MKSTAIFVLAISFCTVTSSIKLFERRGYSIVAKSFKDHGLLKYINKAPTELLQVRFYDKFIILYVIICEAMVLQS